MAASRSAERRVNLPMSTVQTREMGRFPPVPTREVERDGQFVESPESVDARLAAEARLKALVAERLALTPKKEVYVFIHGTGSNFEDPMYVMAGLWHFMGRRGVPVAYTWPAGGADGPLQGYNYDRESSEFTVFHLKQFLRLLASCPGVEKVHILAHSRGTDTALAALRELAIEVRASGGDTRSALKIGCFVLAAADIDLEVSTQRISAERIMRVPEQMVLYVSPTDSTLGMADWLFGSKQRLGQSQEAGDLTRRRTELLQHLPDIQFIDVRRGRVRVRQALLLLQSPRRQFRPDPPAARQPPARGRERKTSRQRGGRPLADRPGLPRTRPRDAQISAADRDRRVVLDSPAPWQRRFQSEHDAQHLLVSSALRPTILKVEERERSKVGSESDD